MKLEPNIMFVTPRSDEEYEALLKPLGYEGMLAAGYTLNWVLHLLESDKDASNTRKDQ